MNNKDTIYGAIFNGSHWKICRDIKEINKSKDNDAIISNSLAEIADKISISDLYPTLIREIYLTSSYDKQTSNYIPETMALTFNSNIPVYLFRPDVTREEIEQTLKSKPKNIIIIAFTRYRNEDRQINITSKFLLDQLNGRTYCPDIPGVINGNNGLEYNLKSWKARRYRDQKPNKERKPKKIINLNHLTGIYYRLVNSFARTGIPKLDRKDSYKGALYPFFDPYNESRTSVSLHSGQGMCERILSLLHIMRRYGNRRLHDLTKEDIRNYLEEYQEHFIKSNKTSLYKSSLEFRIIRKYLIQFIYPYYESLKK